MNVEPPILIVPDAQKVQQEEGLLFLCDASFLQSNLHRKDQVEERYVLLLYASDYS